MNINQPLISIGIPVYNGDNFLKEAIESLLAQTFTDFELIISDNASTDQTEAICREYAAKDQRIRYYRQEVNFGGAKNFSFVVDKSKGKYFKWAAHDDLCEPEFLKKCVEILEQNPDIVLSYPRTKLIDQHGNFVKNYYMDGKLNVSAPNPQERFYELACRGHKCYQIYGLIRANVLKKMPPYGAYGHADGVLLARLALVGPFAEIPEQLFAARVHPDQAMSLFVKKGKTDYASEAYQIWLEPSRKGKIVLPHWRILAEYFLAVSQISLSWQERLACYRHVLGLARYHRKNLVEDLILAFKQRIFSLVEPVENKLKTELESK